MALPTLSLLPAHRADFSESFPETHESLVAYFDLADAKNDADFEDARAVAAALDGVLHSSDVDCEYYPCVLTGPDPTSDAFFTALGVARDARASVSGWDNPKLEVVSAGDGDGRRPALALITRLGDLELAQISDYVGEEDQEAIGRAIERLTAIGPVVGVQLCTDDGVSKVVLTLARRPGGAHVGVATVRIET